MQSNFEIPETRLCKDDWSVYSTKAFYFIRQIELDIGSPPPLINAPFHLGQSYCFSWDLLVQEQDAALERETKKMAGQLEDELFKSPPYLFGGRFRKTSP